MSPLLFMLLSIAGVVAILIVLCLVLSVIMTTVGIWIADHGAKKNAKLVYKHLPKEDCGECGCENCMGYAQWVADCRREMGQCPKLSQESADAITLMYYVPPVEERSKLSGKIADWFRKKDK